MTTYEKEHGKTERQPLLSHIEELDITDPNQRREWLEVRKSFIEANSWQVDETDGDRYDHHIDTIHLVARHPESREIIAGLRLTPIDKVESSLSWSMLSDAMREEAKAKLDGNETHNMWDLTRLITNPNLQSRHDKIMALEAVYALLGAGQQCTTDDNGGSPRWFFTTTEDFLQLSEKKGITFVPLSRGIIPNSATGDTEPPTAFCYADPVNETEKLEGSDDMQHSTTLLSVRRGIGRMASMRRYSEAA